MKYDYIYNYLIGFVCGSLVTFLCILIGISDREYVDVAGFGDKICASQGLAYKNYSMLQNNIPRITCTDKKAVPIEKSLYDGVVVYEKEYSNEQYFDYKEEARYYEQFMHFETDPFIQTISYKNNNTTECVQ